MAEALSLKVLFYDELSMMAIGQAQRKNSLAELLGEADFVVSTITSAPADPGRTAKLFGAREFAQMRTGTFFINATNGEAVELKALAAALASGHLQGAALDAYPAYCYSTTIANVDGKGADTTVIKNPLLQMANVILTPGITSNTAEVQARIASEVTSAVLNYLVCGAASPPSWCGSLCALCPGMSLSKGAVGGHVCPTHPPCTHANSRTPARPYTPTHAHRTRGPPWAPLTFPPLPPGP